MTILDEFLIEESKRQISRHEKTFDLILDDVISNLMEQIKRDPFAENFTVHLVKKSKIDPGLPHEVCHDVDPSKLLFYLTHYGLNKISANALLRSNFSIDKVIRIVVVNKNHL